MDINIIRKAKPLIAKFSNLNYKYRILFVISILSLISILLPHEALAVQLEPKNDPISFEVGDYEEFMDEVTIIAQYHYDQEQIQLAIERQEKLESTVEQYLRGKRSPLTEYVPILLRQKNWKKIVALSNAESGLCKKYIESTANCWGVGGSDLWDMGEDLGEGIVAMNHFLEKYPKSSSVKYSQMSFKRMNGLYKQPPRDHWVYNNQTIYDDLVEIENSI
jgi:hypothetical protein